MSNEPKQMQMEKLEPVAVLVAGGKSVRNACAESGISESTAYRFSSTPEFKQRVAELRTLATDEAVGRLSRLASEAVDTLAEIMRDKGARPSERAAACKTVLAMLSPVAELCEMRARLDAIEAKQGGLEQ